MAEAKVKTKEAKLVKASARYLHIAPRKIRLVTNLVKNMYAVDALVQLRHLNKRGALIVTKLIGSAIANAQHNFSIDPSDLVIKSITADGGPVMKRYMPRARGSASTIHKRMAHINVVLEEKKRSKSKTSRFKFMKKAAGQDEPKTAAGQEQAKVSEQEGKAEIKKSQVAKTSEQKKMNQVQQKRRLFNRKGGE